MNSIQSKSKKFNLVERHAIAGIALVPNGVAHFTLYVAWEWEEMAKKGIFAVSAYPDVTFLLITPQLIKRAADYGVDVTHDNKLIKSLFPNLF